MDSNTSKERPEWLIYEQITAFRLDLMECPDPYTDEEMNDLDCDDPTFNLRSPNAHAAKMILTEYGIPLEE